MGQGTLNPDGTVTTMGADGKAEEKVHRVDALGRKSDEAAHEAHVGKWRGKSGPEAAAPKTPKEKMEKVNGLAARLTTYIDLIGDSGSSVDLSQAKLKVSEATDLVFRHLAG